MSNLHTRKTIVRLHEYSDIDSEYIARSLRGSLSDNNVIHDVSVLPRSESIRSPEQLLIAMARGAIELSAHQKNCFGFHASLVFARIGRGTQVPLSIVLCKGAKTRLSLSVNTAKNCDPPDGMIDSAVNEFQEYARSVLVLDDTVDQAEKALLMNVRAIVTQTIIDCIQDLEGKPSEASLH